MAEVTPIKRIRTSNGDAQIHFHALTDDTGLQINSEISSFEEYIKSVVPFSGDGSPNLDGYATEDYVDNAIDSIGIDNGDGDSSFSIGNELFTLNDYSIATGNKNISGSMGFYIKSVDITNKKIYISLERFSKPEISEVDNSDISFETPEYSIGDEFSIIALTEYGESHVHFCSAISNIQNNVITYTTELPFSNFAETSDDEFHVFTVPKKPKIGNVVVGWSAFSEGESNIAAGYGSHAEGRGNIAAGKYAHVEGRNTKASYAAHAEGLTTIAQGMYSHSEGRNTKACFSAHAEGDSSKAIGDSSHAENLYTTSNAKASHAEGYLSVTNGDYSHAEGFKSTADGEASHAEGSESIASHYASHAEGTKTRANNVHTHAEGYGTVANSPCEHVEGKYNKYLDDNDNVLNYAHVVGNGTSDEARSNAYTLDWNGNAYFAGTITLGNNSTVLTNSDISTEIWSFTLEDGTVINKAVCLK